MKLKNILAASLSVIMTMSVFSGCASAPATSAPATSGTSATSSTSSTSSTASTTVATGDKTNLEFYIWSDEENYIKKVVEKYNGSQDKINVNLTSIPESDYDDKLKVLISGGADLDVVDIRGMAQVTTYANTESLLDITDRIATSKLDVKNYGAMWETSNNDGKFFALPTRSTCWSLYYNKDLFDQAKMEYPIGITWDQYIEISKEMTEKLKDTKSEDGSKIYGGYWVPWIYHFEAVQQGVYCNSEDTTALKQSLETINTAWSNGSHLGFAEAKSGDYDYISEFENGKTAMLPNGEWVVNMLLEHSNAGQTSVNWEVAPMPIPTGTAANTTWGQFQFAAITASSKNPDQAFDFLSYLCGEEGSKVYSESGMIHAYASPDSEAVYKKTTGKDSVSVFFDAKKVQEQPNSLKYGEFVTALNENAELYFLGEKTIDETMKNFETQRVEILK